MVIVCYCFDIKWAAECSGAVQRILMEQCYLSVLCTYVSKNIKKLNKMSSFPNSYERPNIMYVRIK